jgi:hypothetical protein
MRLEAASLPSAPMATTVAVSGPDTGYGQGSP